VGRRRIAHSAPEDIARKAAKLERSLELLLRAHRQIDSQEEREETTAQEDAGAGAQERAYR
jgi:hypothetical protein